MKRLNSKHLNIGLMLSSIVLILSAAYLIILRLIRSQRKMTILVDRIIFHAVKSGLTVNSARVLVCQAYHETGGFQSDLYKKANNLFGIKAHARNISGKKQKTYKGYAVYTSIESSIDDIIHLRRVRGIADEIENIAQYSAILKKAKYYTDAEATYTKGMNNAFKKLFT